MTPRRTLIRRTAVSAVAVTSAVVLAGCGSDTDSASSASSAAGPSATASAIRGDRGSHNAQDVTFTREMIPHHRQAVAMAALAPSRAKSAKVKDLAARIEKAQGPEIDTMSGWLKSWGEKVPDGTAMASASAMPGMESMPGMDHSASPMPGMMSGADMSKLKKLSGDAFDKAFLQMMTGHHEGAVAMAKTEQAKGAYGPAKTMAESIVTSQSAEITEMNALLGE